MPQRRIVLRTTDHDSEVQTGLGRVRAQFQVPDGFPGPVRDEALATSAAPPPADLTALPFFTIDPPGSLDLD